MKTNFLRNKTFQIVVLVILLSFLAVFAYTNIPHLFSESNYKLRNELRTQDNYVLNETKLKEYNFFYIDKSDIRNKLSFWLINKNRYWSYNTSTKTIILSEEANKKELASSLMHEEIHSYDNTNSLVLSKNIEKLLVYAKEEIKNRWLETCETHTFCVKKNWIQLLFEELKKDTKLTTLVSIVNEEKFLVNEWTSYDFSNKELLYSELAAFYFEKIALYYKQELLDLDYLNKVYDWLIKK